MQDWFYEAAIFLAGVLGGIAIATLGSRLLGANRRRRDLSAVRRRILAGVKESHDEEILDEAFRATEALRNELAKSLYRLRASMTVALGPVPQEHDESKQPANPLSKSIAVESRQS